MAGDLPDYEKRIIIVTPPGDYPAVVRVDLRQILGVDFISPTIAGCAPISIENPAIAYDAINDRFKVDIGAMSVGEISVAANITKYLNSAIGLTNPLHAAIVYGGAIIDPRNRNWTITEELNIRALTSADAITAYGNLDKLQQRVTTKELLTWVANVVQIAGSEGTAIQSYGNKLYIIPFGSANQSFRQHASSYDLLVELRKDGVSYDGRQIRTLTTSDAVTVTQAAKDRTISSIDAIATPLQISIAALNGNSSALITPASGKAIRLKFISIEHSAAVDIGYRFGAAGTIYYMRITAGVYVSNLIGCNNQGAADAAFYLNSSGATNVKGYILYQEV